MRTRIRRALAVATATVVTMYGCSIPQSDWKNPDSGMPVKIVNEKEN